MRPTPLCAFALVLLLAPGPVVAAPFSGHFDLTRGTFTSTSVSGYGVGAGFAMNLLGPVAVGIEVTHESDPGALGSGAHAEALGIGDGNRTSFRSAFLSARLRLPAFSGLRVLFDAGVGRAWVSQEQSSAGTIEMGRFATMVGLGFQTPPVLGLLRMEFGARRIGIPRPGESFQVSGTNLEQTAFRAGIGI